jgi:hypothetical protein
MINLQNSQSITNVSATTKGTHRRGYLLLMPNALIINPLANLAGKFSQAKKNS